jgi:hypothetical protein
MQQTSRQYDSQGTRGGRDETYEAIIEHAKSQARRYAALETRDGRMAAVAVLRFARSLKVRRAH